MRKGMKVKNVLALLEIEGVADIEIEKLSQHEDISIAGNETIDKQTAKIVRLKLRKQFGDIEAECEILPKKVMMQSNSAASSPAKFGLIFMFLTAVDHATESKYLSGQGIARQRQAKVDGLRDSVLGSPVHVHGITAKDVMDMIRDGLLQGHAATD
ncbi:hypothetical protein Tco_1192550 [Tanacetum coccineum]